MYTPVTHTGSAHDVNANHKMSALAAVFLRHSNADFKFNQTINRQEKKKKPPNWNLYFLLFSFFLSFFLSFFYSFIYLFIPLSVELKQAVGLYTGIPF